MTPQLCNCQDGLQNLGLVQGVKPFDQLSMIIIVSTFDADGNLNVVDCTVPFTQTFVNSKLNEDDPLKRWYPLGNIKNVVRPKSDAITNEFDDGTSERVRDGVRSFESVIKGGTAVFLGKLLAGRCQSLSFYEIDICGNFLGNCLDAANGNLRPLLMGEDTMDAFLNLADGTQKQNIQFNFQYDISERDEFRDFLTNETIDATLDKRTLTGLKDVNFKFSNETTSSVDFSAKFDYGDFCNKKLMISLAAPAELTLFNKTTKLAVAVSTLDVTDAANGNYGITFPAQTGGDVLCLSILPSNKNGFEAKEQEFTV